MPIDRHDEREFTMHEFATGLREPLMSDEEFADLGQGEWAYIRPLTTEQARRVFPTVDDLPPGVDLYALLAADGTPIVLTDDKGTAISHAMGDELEIAHLH